jgi:hypothetical protein
VETLWALVTSKTTVISIYGIPSVKVEECNEMFAERSIGNLLTYELGDDAADVRRGCMSVGNVDN